MHILLQIGHDGGDYLIENNSDSSFVLSYIVIVIILVLVLIKGKNS